MRDTQDPHKKPANGVPDPPEFDMDSMDLDMMPPLPPDGGWGWMVTFASFIINVIVDGIVYSFGMVLPVLCKEFDEPQGKINWIGSLVPGVYLCMGPVVSAMVNVFGVRKVTILGGLISGCAFFIASFMPDINWLIVTWGFLGGFGFSFMYLPSLVIVSQYFAKKRSLATGIATCGSGIGAFLISELTLYLLDTAGWRGTLLIYSGLAFNGVVCGALFRPLEYSLRRRHPKNKKKGDELPKSIIMQKIIEHKKRIRTISSGSTNGFIITNDNMLVPGPTAVDTALLTPKLLNGNAHAHSVSEQNTPILHRRLEAIRETEAGPPSMPRAASEMNMAEKLTQEEKVSYRKEVVRPLNRQDIFYSGSVTSLPEYHETGSVATYIESNTTLPKPADEDGSPGRFDPFSNVMKSMLDLSLFKSITFNLLCLNVFLVNLGFFQPYFHLPVKVLDDGFTPEHAAWLVKILGICNVVGRLGAGMLAIKVDALWIQNVSLWIAGLTTALMPLVPPHPDMYPVFCAYCVIFGNCTAAFIALRTIVTGDLMGQERLTNAFGLSILFQGAAAIIGPPIAGFIYDSTGSYTLPFVLSGLTVFVAGIVQAPARCVSRYEQRKLDGYDAVTTSDMELPAIKLHQDSDKKKATFDVDV